VGGKTSMRSGLKEALAHSQTVKHFSLLILELIIVVLKNGVRKTTHLV
jgi:hypothetical protein